MKKSGHIGKVITCLFLPALLFTAVSCNKDAFRIPDRKTVTIRSDSTNGNDVTVNFHDGVPISAESNGNHIPELAIYAWTNGGAYVEGKSYIRFDLSAIPSGAQILSATLNLYGKTSGEWIPQGNQGDNAFWVERVLGPWDQLTLTWNSAPPTTSVNRVLTPNSTSVWENDLSIPVTELVQDMIDNKERFGFCLSVSENVPYRSFGFATCEAADTLKRPSLVLTYW
jgi:hypothetical protein